MGEEEYWLETLSVLELGGGGRLAVGASKRPRTGACLGGELPSTK